MEHSKKLMLEKLQNEGAKPMPDGMASPVVQDK